MVKHLREGQDFGPEHFPADFGFTGSTSRQRYAKGGKVCYADGGEVDETEGDAEGGPAMAKGGNVHPHGHHVVNVEQLKDGSVVHHHAHGGHTIHHADGQISHHDEMGEPVSGVPHAGIEGLHDSSEYVHRAKGGHSEEGEGAADEGQDKAMIKKAFREHDSHFHEGKHEDIQLAHGGMPRPMPRPGRLNPMAPKPRTAPPSSPAGGAMGFGNQPSTEPGSSGITQMSKGGRNRQRG